MPPSASRFAQLTGSLLVFFGVVLGAFAAHAAKDFLYNNGTLDIWKTAVLYQFVHGLAMLAVGGWAIRTRGPVACWLVGTICFSGSLYLLAYDPTRSWLGPITPLGGLLFLIGWIWLIANVLLKRAA